MSSKRGFVFSAFVVELSWFNFRLGLNLTAACEPESFPVTSTVHSVLNERSDSRESGVDDAARVGSDRC